VVEKLIEVCVERCRMFRRYARSNVLARAPDRGDAATRKRRDRARMGRTDISATENAHVHKKAALIPDP
jgi:hypothetical protein